MSLKRIWSALTLAVVAGVLVAPSASAAAGETVIDGVTYMPVSAVVSEGAAAVSSERSDLPPLVDIPSTVTIDGTLYDVTIIGNSAFENKRMTAVIIPSSVTTIGLNAFAENSLTTITIPNSVITIGNGAFDNNQLESVTIGTSVNRIGVNAFRANSLTTITLPPSVTMIHTGAFSQNPGLENVVFLGAAGGSGASIFGTTGSPNGPLVSFYGRYPTFTAPTWIWSGVEYRSQALATVTFDANQYGTTPVSVDVPVNSHLTAVPDPAPVTGYTFDAWYFQGVPVGVGTYITEDLTVYAHWTADTHAVRFESENGVDAIVQNVNDNETATTPAVPTWEGHTFNGWFTAASGGAAFNFSTPITAATTAYAQWALNEYAVTFEPGNGLAATVQTMNHGGIATTPISPTWTGHTLTGWFTAATGGTAFNFSTPITAATTAYAQWTLNEYAVTFEPGTGLAATVQTIDYGDVATMPAAPTWTGHTFNGWFTAATGGTAFNFATPITAATTAYAQWALNSAAVSSPSTATQGEVITMSGSGYIPGESLEIWLLSDPVLLKTIVADGTGAFTTTVSIPAATLAGAHHLEVRGTSSATVSRAINIRAGLANTGSEHGMALTLALLLTAAGTALVVRQHRSA